MTAALVTRRLARIGPFLASCVIVMAAAESYSQPSEWATPTEIVKLRHSEIEWGALAPKALTIVRPANLILAVDAISDPSDMLATRRLLVGVRGEAASWSDFTRSEGIGIFERVAIVESSDNHRYLIWSGFESDSLRRQKLPNRVISTHVMVCRLAGTICDQPEVLAAADSGDSRVWFNGATTSNGLVQLLVEHSARFSLLEYDHQTGNTEEYTVSRYDEYGRGLLTDAKLESFNDISAYIVANYLVPSGNGSLASHLVIGAVPDWKSSRVDTIASESGQIAGFDLLADPETSSNHAAYFLLPSTADSMTKVRYVSQTEAGWSSPVTIAEAGAQLGSTTVIEHPRGVQVFWTQISGAIEGWATMDTYWSYSEDGANWSSPASILPDGPQKVSPVLVAKSDSTLHAVFQSGTGQLLYSSSPVPSEQHVKR